MENTIINAQYRFLSDGVLIQKYQSVLNQIWIEGGLPIERQNHKQLELWENHADDLLDEIIERNLLDKVNKILEL